MSDDRHSSRMTNVAEIEKRMLNSEAGFCSDEIGLFRVLTLARISSRSDFVPVSVC